VEINNMPGTPGFDDAVAARDHRTRANTQQQIQPANVGEHGAQSTAGAHPEAGGIVAVSAGQQGETRDSTSAAGEQERAAHRLQAFAELANTFRLPADTRVSIQVDESTHQVRFLIRDRKTGEVLREVPEPTANSFLQRLEKSVGSLLDRLL
jgi:uncharacterized FlaG/YvyC family protein